LCRRNSRNWTSRKPRLRLYLEDNLNVCAGDTVEVSIINSNSDFTYSWSPESTIISGQGSPTVQVVVLDQLELTASVTTAECDLEESITIGVLNAPDLLLTATADPSSILLGQSSQLNASINGLEYTWEPSSTLNDNSVQNPVSTPLETTTYTVTAGEDECTQTALVTVNVVDFICGGPTIFVPNAFSPNGDGENDVLFAYGQNELFPLELIFRVYNRWGQKVFETTDFTQGWDGYFNGKLSDPAVFDYYIEVSCPGGEEFFEKGNITLVR